jgi:hypothetical protein
MHCICTVIDYEILGGRDWCAVTTSSVLPLSLTVFFAAEPLHCAALHCTVLYGVALCCAVAYSPYEVVTGILGTVSV